MISLDFFGKLHDLYVVDESFPIPTSGLLGLQWEVEMNAISDRKQNTITLHIDDKIREFKLGKHPVAHIPPLTTNHIVTLKWEKPAGTYNIYGDNILDGIYPVTNNQIKILTENDCPHRVFLYGEDIKILDVKNKMSYIDEHDEPSGDLCYLCTDPTKVSRTQYENTFLRTCLDNKLSASDRQNALKNYYANEQTRLSFFAQSNPRIKTIKEKFNVQLKNISRYSMKKLLVKLKILLLSITTFSRLNRIPYLQYQKSNIRLN